MKVYERKGLVYTKDMKCTKMGPVNQITKLSEIFSQISGMNSHIPFLSLTDFSSQRDILSNFNYIR